MALTLSRVPIIKADTYVDVCILILLDPSLKDITTCTIKALGISRHVVHTPEMVLAVPL